MAGNSDVVVALVHQHKAGLLQAVDAVNTSEKVEELLLEVYNKTEHCNISQATHGSVKSVD